MEFLQSIEQLSFSTWIREGGSLWGYAFVIFMHTVGLAIMVGGTFAINLRLLGVAPKLPLKPLERLYPYLWIGLAINAISGTILLMADATTKLINPVFYIKMVLIAVGIVVLKVMQKKVFGDPALEQGVIPAGAKGLAWVSLICWLGAITAGRLLAYIGPVAGLA